MQDNELSPKGAWLLSKEISQLAFIFEKQTKDNTDSNATQDLKNLFLEFHQSIEKYREAKEKTASPFFHHANVSRITEVIKLYQQEQITAEKAKLDIWDILVPPHPDDLFPEDDRPIDEPRNYDRDAALKFSLPTEEEIKVEGGPVVWARSLWEDHNKISKRTLATLKSKSDKNELAKPNISDEFYLHSNRATFIESVLDHIINLNRDEIKGLGLTLLQVSEKLDT